MFLKRGAANLLLAACSIGGSLFLLEGIARALHLGTSRWYTHTARNSIAGTLQYVPGSEEHYHSPEFDCTIKANRFGRCDVEWTKTMIDDPRNVLMVGDSFALGFRVNDADSPPTLLERAFEKAGEPREVFNFAFFGSLPEYVRLLEEALDIGVRAKLVIVGIFVGNDFSLAHVFETGDATPAAPEVPERKRPRWLRSDLLTFLRVRFVSSPEMMGAAFRAANLLGIPIYGSEDSFIFVRRLSVPQRAHVDSTLAEMLVLRDLCARNDRHLVFSIFPAKIQVENPKELTNSIYDADQPNRFIREFSERHHLDCVDLTPALRARYESMHRRLYMPYDRHWNEEGDRVAMAALFDSLCARGLDLATDRGGDDAR